MSFSKDITIWCDHHDCTASGRSAVTDKSVPMARRTLRADGWSFTRAGGDRCPEHTKETR